MTSRTARSSHYQRDIPAPIRHTTIQGVDAGLHPPVNEQCLSEVKRWLPYHLVAKLVSKYVLLLVSK